MGLHLLSAASHRQAQEYLFLGRGGEAGRGYRQESDRMLRMSPESFHVAKKHSSRDWIGGRHAQVEWQVAIYFLMLVMMVHNNVKHRKSVIPKTSHTKEC